MKKTILILVAAALAACSGKQPAAPSASQPQSSAVEAAKLPPGHPPLDPAAQVAPVAQNVSQSNVRATTPVSNPQDRSTLTGKVLETMNSGGYTYVRLEIGPDKVWAAVPQTSVKKGSTITVAVQMVMDNFQSNSLNRKFDKLLFATLVSADAKPKLASAMPAMQSASNPMGGSSEHMKPAIDTGSIKVEKAEGGHTVAEVWSSKAALSDKPVVVRGKVVKFLPQIMGKNWLHLRDGSGARDKGDDDITVTTNDSVKVGDVVTVTGTLRVDKDFGAGYRYPVIVEDAKIK